MIQKFCNRCKMFRQVTEDAGSSRGDRILVPGRCIGQVFGQVNGAKVAASGVVDAFCADLSSCRLTEARYVSLGSYNSS